MPFRLSWLSGGLDSFQVQVLPIAVIKITLIELLPKVMIKMK